MPIQRLHHGGRPLVGRRVCRIEFGCRRSSRGPGASCRRGRWSARWRIRSCSAASGTGGIGRVESRRNNIAAQTPVKRMQNAKAILTAGSFIILSISGPLGPV